MRAKCNGAHHAFMDFTLFFAFLYDCLTTFPFEFICFIGIIFAPFILLISIVNNL